MHTFLSMEGTIVLLQLLAKKCIVFDHNPCPSTWGSLQLTVPFLSSHWESRSESITSAILLFSRMGIDLPRESYWCS